MERISYAGTDKTEWTIEPSYTLAIAHHMMDENEMANAIIQSAGDQISEGTALYLDGELTAVCSDGNSLRDYLAAMLDPYEEEEDDPDVSVGFNKQVTLEDGLYFKEGLQDFETVRQELVGVKQAQKVYTVKAGDTLWSIAHNNDLTFRELCALNPAFKGEPLSETSSILEGDHLVITKEEAGLEVRITRIETREEEIAFSTETTRSNEYTKGTTKVLQEGENGLRRVTLQNVYDTNNILVDQSVLSTEVIKEPVNKKVVKGTKKVTSSTKYITGSGQFIWPVPKLPLLLALVRRTPQGRGHLRPGRYAHLRLRRRHRHQGGLQQGRCRYGLWLLGHHQPRRRIQLCVCTLPVPDRQRRPDRQAGPAHRLSGQHGPFHRQPLPLRDTSQWFVHSPAERIPGEEIIL